MISIIGGSGSVGSRVVAGLMARGADIRCVTRPDSRLFTIKGKLPPHALADLDDPPTLRRALEGTDTLLLITQMHPDEERRGLAAVSAARSAGVRRIVYQSTLSRPGLQHPLHYRSKIPVEAAIAEGGFESAVYRPNSFHQNDEFLRAAILGGVYPQPVGGKGVSRIDVRDVAASVVQTLLDDSPGRLDYELHGPEPITGEQTAAIYTEALANPVGYGGDDVDVWADASRAFMQGWMVDALADMYRYFQQHGMMPLPGRPPADVLPAAMISTADYAREKAEQWRPAA